ncbi:MAG: hypothetical protein GF344_15470 [Chitinivibrionales bacterium]|nr:hypothetical protein [Chitinivibrionales bacterium]MBD3358104.1 hypothetical protein [Chitinivibrionales bacterium]
MLFDSIRFIVESKKAHWNLMRVLAEGIIMHAEGTNAQGNIEMKVFWNNKSRGRRRGDVGFAGRYV